MSPLVPYSVFPLEQGKQYRISMSSRYGGSVRDYSKRSFNALSMFAEGRPVAIVIPERNLSPAEKEEYRAFFCKEAKRVKRNLIYFEGPVTIDTV